MVNTEDGNAVDEILDIALEAGVTILQNGGETYRAEETMIAIASSLGAESASAFVTPTVVMLTCMDSADRSHTRIQRITARTINLGKIARVNELSRRLVGRGRKTNLRQVDSLIRRIHGSPLHHPVFIILATACASFFFSLLFSGTIVEALSAFAIGAALRLVLFFITPLGLSSFIVSLSGGLVISILSGLAVVLGILPSAGNVSISVLMSLVPGLAIVNAIRDIIAGDLVAGSARLLEAFVIAAALSLGAAFGLMLVPAGSSLAPAVPFLSAPAPAFLFSFFATASFAYFFYINRYDLFWTSLFGAAGWVVYLTYSQGTGSQATGYMLGALCVGACSEFCAVLMRKPATVYIVPGIIPLVPGGGMYETMLFSVQGNMDAAAVTGFRTLTAAGAIAVGIALASSLARLAAKARQSVRARLSARRR